MDIPENLGEVLGRLMSDPQVMNAVRSLSAAQPGGGMADSGVPIAMRQDVRRESGFDGGSDGGMGGGNTGQRIDERRGDDKPDGGNSRSNNRGNYRGEDMRRDGGSGGDDKRRDDDSNRRQKGTNNRSALLHALEPYLSSDRRKKLDGIVRVIELLEFARTSHLLDDLDIGMLSGLVSK